MGCSRIKASAERWHGAAFTLEYPDRHGSVAALLMPGSQGKIGYRGDASSQRGSVSADSVTADTKPFEGSPSPEYDSLIRADRVRAG